MGPIISKTLKNKCTKQPILILILTCLSMQACRDFIELDLTDKNLVVLGPSDTLTTTVATINFYWEPLDGATSYHIQLVKPSFDNVQHMLVDSSVTGTTFTHIFSPGTYQWRIRAENGNTNTPYVTRTIIIDSTTNLADQSIILISPSLDYATNSTSITLNWFGLYNADSYRAAIKVHASGFSGALVIPETTTVDTFITLSGLPEGYLDWGIRGESVLSATPYATRGIYIDLTSPLTPTLSSPANGTSITGPDFTLSWSNGSDSGSPLYDSIIVYSNATLSTIKKAYYLNTGFVTDTIGVGTYYWRVKAIDKAGNKSSYSVTRSFTVN